VSPVLADVLGILGLLVEVGAVVVGATQVIGNQISELFREAVI
jgi:hypothetical protein